MASVGSPLQGYLAGLQMKQQQERMMQQQEQAEEQHDLLQKQIDNEAKQHQQQLDLQTMMAKVNLQHMYNMSLGTPSQTPQSALQPGVGMTMDNSNPNQLPTPQGSVAQQPTSYNLTPEQGYSGEMAKLFPEGIPIDPNYIPRQLAIQRAQGQIEAQNKGLAAGAVSEAEGPEKEKIANIEAQGKFGPAYLSSQARIKSAELAANSRIAAANISASAKQGQELDPDDVNSAAQAMATGEPITGIPAKTKIAALTSLHKSGMEVFDSKTKSSLQALNDMQGVFGQMEQMADMLSDNPAGVLGTTIKQHLGLGSNLRNQANEVGARVGQIMRGAAGLSGQRFNQVEINKVLRAMADGTITRSQAQKNIMDWRSDVYNKASNDLLGGYSPGQKRMLMEKYAPSAGVKMQAPNGEIDIIDPGQVSHYIQMGAKVIQ